MTTNETSDAISYKRRGPTGTLTLRGRLDIFEAQALRSYSLRAVEDSKASTIHVDLTAALQLDVATTQVLFALRHDLEKAGRTLTIEPVPVEISLYLCRLGLLQ